MLNLSRFRFLLRTEQRFNHTAGQCARRRRGIDMSKEKQIKSVIHAKDTEITVLSMTGEEDYISLTDIARYVSDEPKDVVKNWLRNRETISFLGLWEQLNNPNFKGVEFDSFKMQAGSNAFTLSPQKWIRETNAIGIRSKSGKYGGTFAHKDIAFEFASWVSPEFKLYIIQDYQRLKQDEQHKNALEWNVKRLLSKANYRVHTDAVKENLIPPELPEYRKGMVYADEADVLNVALFGKTAKEWRAEHPEVKKGENQRDYATIEQLLVMANLESMNALLITQGMPQAERAIELNRHAIKLMTQMEGSHSAEQLKQMDDRLKLPESE